MTAREQRREAALCWLLAAALLFAVLGCTGVGAPEEPVPARVQTFRGPAADGTGGAAMLGGRAPGPDLLAQLDHLSARVDLLAARHQAMVEREDDMRALLLRGSRR